MQFHADAVHRILAMLEPGLCTPEDAGRLAERVGSWPEVLARPRRGFDLHLRVRPEAG